MPYRLKPLSTGRAMARLASALLAASAWATPAAASSPAEGAEALSGEPAERHLSLRLDPAGRTLAGELIQALPRGGQFRLLPGLEVETARCDDAPLAVAHEGEGLWRVAPCPGQATLSWSGRLGEGAGERSLRLTEAGSLLPTRAGWYPHLAERAGPLVVEVETPASQRAVASGSLVEERTTAEGRLARFHHPHTLALEVAAGPWQRREREVNGVTLRVLFPEALDAAFGATYLERATAHLQAFEQRLGDFPFTSFSIAASPAPVGVAFPGFTLLGERVIPLPFIPETSLPHEIMHAWWGAGVLVEYADGNWAEALTTYLADHAVAEAAGEDAELRRGWLRDLAALPPGQEDRLRDFRGGQDPAGRLIGYQHGALLFHMLRKRLGDDAFDAALRELADAWMHRRADWQALEAAFGAAAEEDLAPFFSAWRDRSSRPDLALEGVRLEDESGTLWLRGELVQRGDNAPWPLAVALVVETASGPVTLNQDMESERQPFGIPLGERPLALEVDPDADLARHPGTQPSLLRRLLLDTDARLVALTPALEPLAERALARRLETRPAEAGLDDAPPLLVVGSTEQVAEWRRSQGLTAPPRDALEPEALETAGRARFWMHPDHPIGLLSGDDVDSLALLAARLRHHGQRSHLVLDADGETRRAGTWPAGENPLRVVFPEDSGPRSGR
ncbi:M1 family metallopeptidase [Halomonas mongoliensis]|uniref:M1 family metallopeptidase n=1 Tax=Halomonas mongoliensis TaxID=321265 RepID=UPI00403A84C2